MKASDFSLLIWIVTSLHYKKNQEFGTVDLAYKWAKNPKQTDFDMKT